VRGAQPVDAVSGVYGLAFKTRLNGASVARRKLVKPAARKMSRKSNLTGYRHTHARGEVSGRLGGMLLCRRDQRGAGHREPDENGEVDALTRTRREVVEAA
jgi:hypothetical protein